MHRCVLNVANFLSQHPGGELAILALTGEDAIAELDIVHPPDVIEKQVPDAIFGVVNSGGAAKSSLPVATNQGDAVANLKTEGNWRIKAINDTPEPSC